MAYFTFPGEDQMAFLGGEVYTMCEDCFIGEETVGVIDIRITL
jgi:hypothetical protein